MSDYRGKWTPGGYVTVAPSDAETGDTPRRHTALTGARNGLPDRVPYLWNGEDVARSAEVSARLELTRQRVRATLDAEYGPGYGAHVYGQCAGECGYCAVERAEEMQK